MVFAREIEDHQLVAANFLGLAEIRLASGDTAVALDLLRRLVVAVGNPFENLDPAAALLEKTGHNAEAIEFLDLLVKSAPWDSSYRIRLAKAKIAAANGGDATQDVLAAIATTPNAPYDLRLKAATTLAGHVHSDLGSEELNLLARSPLAMSAAAADKFYFYAARIKAAQQTSDPQTRLQLLSHCVIDFPRRDEARVPLFESATVAAESDEYALAILESMLQTTFLHNDVSVTGREEEQIARAGSGDDEREDWPASPVTPGLQVSHSQQALVTRTIGDAMVRLNRFADAVAYYESARRVESSPAARKNLLRKIADTKAVLRVQRENAAHQPLLHEALEQDRVVRPKLIARVMPALKSAAVRGGVKQ
jgi:tetratricopeptide (TPR) repeat protein